MIGHPGGVIDVEAIYETGPDGGPVLKRASYAPHRPAYYGWLLLRPQPLL